jgi:hypothetical protein
VDTPHFTQISYVHGKNTGLYQSSTESQPAGGVRVSILKAMTAKRSRRTMPGRQPARNAAYRRLLLTIAGLDVPTLADQLRAARQARRLTALPRAA